MSTQPFWDRIAQDYAQKPIKNPAAYEEKLSTVSGLLRPTDHLLEIGCGTGNTALQLASKVAHITGTDGSRAMIQIAQAKLGTYAPANVSFHVADAADMTEGPSFDVICAFSLLHLIKDVPHLLGRIHEQLKPGGLFISKTECLKDQNILLRALVPLFVATGLAPNVTFLSSQDLHRLLQAAGFEVEQTSYFGPKRTSPFIVSRRPTA